MIYVANAFSLQMVPRHLLPRVRVAAIERPILAGLEWESCVGHADTAALLGVPMRRVSVTIAEGDSLYVAQIVGGRLPEGATTLPAGARIEWVHVGLSGQADQRTIARKGTANAGKSLDERREDECLAAEHWADLTSDEAAERHFAERA